MDTIRKGKKAEIGEVRNWAGVLWVKHQDGWVHVHVKGNHKLEIAGSGGKQVSAQDHHIEFARVHLDNHHKAKETEVPNLVQTKDSLKEIQELEPVVKPTTKIPDSDLRKKQKEEKIQKYFERWGRGEYKLGDGFELDFNEKNVSWKNSDKIYIAKIEKLPDGNRPEFLVRTLQGNRLFKVSTQKLSESKPISNYVGESPFAKEIPFTSHHYSLENLMSEYFNFNVKEGKEYEGTRTERKINTDPHIDLPDTRKPYYYQRGYVWGEYQKQELINSIYNRVETGRIVIRKRSHEHSVKVKKEGEQKQKENLGNWDLVDGKQRMMTIRSFIKGEFMDEYGNYFEDLSSSAQRDFKNTNFNVTLLDESCSDEAVLMSFLRTNTGGIAQDNNHLKEIKNILKKF